jgi:hypothetical protein
LRFAHARGTRGRSTERIVDRIVIERLFGREVILFGLVTGLLGLVNLGQDVLDQLLLVQYFALVRIVVLLELVQLLLQLIWLLGHQYFCTHFLSFFLIFFELFLALLFAVRICRVQTATIVAPHFVYSSDHYI